MFSRPGSALVFVLVALTPPRATEAQAQRALTIDDAIRRALAAHPHIAAAAEGVRASRGSRLTARSWGNPTLNYEIEHETAVGPPGTTLMERKVSTFAMVPLEPIYQLRSRAARANADVRRAEANLREARRQVVLSAAAAYYRVAVAQVAVDASEDVRAWLDSLLAYTRSRVTEGVTAEADLIRLEVEHGRADTEVAMARVELAHARADLGVAIGSDSLEVMADSTSVPAPLPLPPLEAFLALAHRNRPDVVAATAAVDAANAGLGMERASLVREVSAMAGMMNVSGERSLMAGFSMPFPLFDQNRGEIQRASAEGRAAAIDRSLVMRQLAADVTSAYASVREMAGTVNRLGVRFVSRAAEGRHIAEGAYKEGAAPLIQVLDAARAFADARQLYAQALYGWREGIIELNAAIGSESYTGTPTQEVR